jgi:hypothetical protein
MPPSRPSQGIYHPTLSSYYPHLLTLRQYLEDHLIQPKSSASGDPAFGNPECTDAEGSSSTKEEELEDLLDKTLVASDQVLSEGMEVKRTPADAYLTQQEVSP